MSKFSIEEFVRATSERDRGGGPFELENDRTLEIQLDGKVWIKMGSMIAYTGSIKFTREGVLEHGLGKMLKKAVTGEGTMLTKAEGKGNLYLADSGKKISVIDLQSESITVNGNDLLAFQESIKWDITMMKKVTGMLAGGIFNVRLEGEGMIAITTHYDPVTLIVKPGEPVFTDPNATVAWSSNLAPDLKADISLKTLVGRTSGETIQMKFDGDGFVVIQPFEEIYYMPATA